MINYLKHLFGYHNKFCIVEGSGVISRNPSKYKKLRGRHCTVTRLWVSKKTADKSHGIVGS